jgi:hypothetical protein
MSDKDKLGPKVAVDITPVSLQCYDGGMCPAVTTLQNEIPSVKVETNEDGTTIALCPISKFAQAQATVQRACLCCQSRHR